MFKILIWFSFHLISDEIICKCNKKNFIILEDFRLSSLQSILVKAPKASVIRPIFPTFDNLWWPKYYFSKTLNSFKHCNESITYLWEFRETEQESFRFIYTGLISNKWILPSMIFFRLFINFKVILVGHFDMQFQNAEITCKILNR